MNCGSLGKIPHLKELWPSIWTSYPKTNIVFTCYGVLATCQALCSDFPQISSCNPHSNTVEQVLILFSGRYWGLPRLIKVPREAEATFVGSRSQRLPVWQCQPAEAVKNHHGELGERHLPHCSFPLHLRTPVWGRDATEIFILREPGSSTSSLSWPP